MFVIQQCVPWGSEPITHFILPIRKKAKGCQTHFEVDQCQNSVICLSSSTCCLDVLSLCTTRLRSPPPTRPFAPSRQPELLLIAWGVCFIATRIETSTYKGRDFTQLIQRGKGIASRKQSRRSSRRRSSTRTEPCGVEGSADERPEWSAEEGVRQDHHHGGVVVPSVSTNSAKILSCATLCQA